MTDDPGRPGRDETSDYYHPYVDLVPDGDIRAILEVQRQETLAFLRTIPAAKARHRYAAGKWSVSEVIGHINDAERLFVMRAFWFARGMTTPLPSYEGDEAMVLAAHGARPLGAHADEFDAVRAATIAFFRTLPPDAWLRRGTASGRPFSVRALAYVSAGHVTHHLNIVRERYL